MNPGLGKLVNENAPRLWLLGLVSSLSMNLYKIHRLQPVLLQQRSQVNCKELCKILREADGATKQAAKDALQDLVDLIIPLSLMGTVQASPGVVGLAGTFTSILGLSSLWPKQSQSN